MPKAINKEYLISSLKAFNEQILSRTYQKIFANRNVLNKLNESDDGSLTYDGEKIGNGVSAWSDISGKPFNSIDTALSDTSENPVQNKVIKKYVDDKSYITSVEYANTESGIEDTPVGHIISHMGITAPKHYLVCDGAVYNITDYPHLAEHFRNEFGNVNYFGGDGTTTFAVPDLRGEFLRGMGTAKRNTGSGASVGTHQNPTEHLYFGVAVSTKTIWTDTSSPGPESQQINGVISKRHYDSFLKRTIAANTNGFSAKLSEWSGATNWSHFTSRPTNTSVLYCIKCEPTYYMSVAKEIYSTEERVIGTWIDGKPVYQKTFYKESATAGAEVNVGTVNNVKQFISSEGVCKRRVNGFFTTIGHTNANYLQSATLVGFSIPVNTLLLYPGEDITDIYITIKYTKTTD